MLRRISLSAVIAWGLIDYTPDKDMDATRDIFNNAVVRTLQTGFDETVDAGSTVVNWANRQLSRMPQ